MGVFGHYLEDGEGVINAEQEQEVIKFASKPETVSVIVGRKQEWSLPQLAGTYSPVVSITISPGAALSPYFKYDQQTNLITYSDEDGTSAKFAPKFFFIEIYLSNQKGATNNYTQNMILREQEVEEQTIETSVPKTDVISKEVVYIEAQEETKEI